MANHLEPMIKLQPGGEASVLSYNVPEPTTYSGRNFIDLQLPDSYFIPSKPEVTINGLAASPESRALASSTEPYNVLAASGADRLSPKLASLTPEEVAQMAEQGKKLNLYRSMTGALTYNYIDAEGLMLPCLLPLLTQQADGPRCSRRMTAGSSGCFRSTMIMTPIPSRTRSKSRATSPPPPPIPRLTASTPEPSSMSGEARLSITEEEASPRCW
ncbi:hypothetical protein N6H14_25340 [Paenibacillus sp. CC-CFT747]|nr:hypothetical protein N6H14_25340 [Paenibacillus sp. CC-CFT747]